MIFTQYYLDCLSQASYLIGDEVSGRAAVVDPRRDIGEYVRDAEEAGLTIGHVIETHFHADFLSGHLELAEATGAEICFGAAAETEFPARFLADGARIDLGAVTLEVRATPGHTPESISVVVWERADDEVPYGVLTGDTLFIGDVGRPDLLSSVGVTADELAAQLYRSLHEQLLTLPDSTRVFPAHGAGSACGKNLSTETSSTIGEQRSTNYALAPMTVEEFTAVVTADQPTAPLYFVYDATRNREAHELLDEHAPDPMALEHVLRAQAEGAIVLDTRDAEDFARGHLRGAINVGLGGRFAEWVGAVVTPDADLALVCERGTAGEAKVRLGRIGFDRVTGALDDYAAAFAARPGVVERASRLSAAELAACLRDLDVQLVDIRTRGEVVGGTIRGAAHRPLAELARGPGDLAPDRPTVVYCAGGYRSSIAASLLRRRGFGDVSDVVGGYGAWAALA